MSTNWDVMRQYEERMKELREEAEEEGIEINEVSVSNAMQFLHDMSPPGTDPSEEPSRLLKHKEVDGTADDEWQLPGVKGEVTVRESAEVWIKRREAEGKPEVAEKARRIIDALKGGADSGTVEKADVWADGDERK